MAKFNVVPARERAAVWEINPEGVRGTLFEIDAGKHVRLEKSWSRRRGERVPRELREILTTRSMPVVVSLHPSLATTAIFPFVMAVPEDSRDVRTEFQGLVREIVNRANLDMRREAAGSLGVEELDAVLFDARVMRLKMDGKEIVRFADLAGTKLEGAVHVMFTTRPVYEEFHELLHSRKEIFVTEGGKAALSFLERRMAPPLRLLELEPGREELAFLDYRKEQVLKETSFAASGPLSALREEWALSETAARAVFDAWQRGETSDAVVRFMKKIMEQSKNAFEKSLDKARISGIVFVRAAYPLPFSLPFTHGRVELVQYPLKDTFETLGFSGEDALVSDEARVPALLAFLEYYYHRGDPQSHRALTRQIHWIAP